MARIIRMSVPRVDGRIWRSRKMRCGELLTLSLQRFERF